MNGRLKRHGNGNDGHCLFRCEPIFEEDAIEARFFAKMKDEADLEIRRREASKELPLGIRVERFPGFVLG